jgi:hypothetical protein
MKVPQLQSQHPNSAHERTHSRRDLMHSNSYEILVIFVSNIVLGPSRGGDLGGGSK